MSRYLSASRKHSRSDYLQILSAVKLNQLQPTSREDCHFKAVLKLKPNRRLFSVAVRTTWTPLYQGWCLDLEMALTSFPTIPPEVDADGKFTR